MQIVGKCLAWIGILGMLRIAWLAQYYSSVSEPTKNRIVILSGFFPCVAMAGIWLLRRPPLSMMIVGWAIVAILQLETLGVLSLALFHNDIAGDDQFRITHLCVTLPVIMCAGWWFMWRASKRPEASGDSMG
ncbi:MAG: hypothetical protein JWP89_62 [Schlesneria sp.]|nr:hypothetical protein [Schlesneria sp.]